MTRSAPNEARGFVHARIGGALKGFLGGGFAGAGLGFINPTGGTGDGRTLGLGISPSCGRGMSLNSAGQCVAESILGIALPRVGTAIGTALSTAVESQVQVGAGGGMLLGGVAPVGRSILTRSCPRGFVLGRDEVCYDRRVIPNKLRKWPRGTKPLLTGGDVSCLRKAASLEKKIKTIAKKYLAAPPRRPR